MMKEYPIRHRVTIFLAAFLLASGNAAGESTSFEMLAVPGTGQWADFSLSGDGEDMGCVLDGAVYWWTSGKGFRLLDEGVAGPAGVGMAADGGALVSSRAERGGALPAIWYRDGSSVDLGFLTGDCNIDHGADGGFDLNGDGTIAVGQTASCSAEMAFVWTAGNGLRTLPTTGAADSRGTAVSADGGLVVGYCEHPQNGYRRPALWRGGAGPELFLGTDSAGEALNVSANGRYVVGQAEMGGLGPQAFFWEDGSPPVGLGNLSGRATDTSTAKAVSDDGRVVGWSGDTMWGDQEAFIWTADGGMQSLAAHLAARGVRIPRGMTLTAALDISADGGTVVGTARDRDWNPGYWRVRLGDAPERPAVRPNQWEPRPLDHVRPDSLDTFPADILNPFPFGKRRF